MKRYSILAFCFLIACQEHKVQQAPEAPDTVSIKNTASAISPTFMVVNMNATEFKQTWEAAKNAVLLDVRNSDEYAQGHIANAQLLDWESEAFDNKIAEMDRNQIYFVYCAGGNRSRQACDKMKMKGFKNLYNLENGINGWSEQGFDVVK